MARVVLHIGTHKTGSTAVQNTFAANRRLLARHGIAYPEISRGQPAHHGLAALWNTAVASHEPRGGAEAAWDDLVRRHARAPGILLLSSEEFARIDGPNRTDFPWIRDRLAAFERVEVICLLRDQISYAQSLYLELCKDTLDARANAVPLPGWAQFLASAFHRKGIAAGLPLDYVRLHDALLEALPPSRIHLVPYARGAQHPHGSAGLILDRLGCGLDTSRLTLSGDGGRANVTSDPLSVWAAAQIAAPDRPSDALVALVREAVRERFGERTSLYSGAEIEAMRKRYRPVNRRLAERLADRDPSFALPWTTYGGATRRGQLDRAFWIDVARRLHAAS